MRGIRMVLPLLLLLGNGCTHWQLKHNTVTQVNTITDIHYKQVLNNLAAIESNPHGLPHFAVVGSGGTLVVDGANASFGLSWDNTTLIGQALDLGGSRTFEDGWTVAPIVDPDKLRAMRAAYQITSRGQVCDPRGYELLQLYLGSSYMDLLCPGWYRVGRKCDVPWCDASYVAHCGDTYVWVTPEGLNGLSQLTLVILNIATIDPDAAIPPQKEVQQYYYKNGAIDRVEKYYVPGAAMPGAVPPSPESFDGSPIIPSYPVPPRRENYYNPLQSQIQLYGR